MASISLYLKRVNRILPPKKKKKHLYLLKFLIGANYTCHITL